MIKFYPKAFIFFILNIFFLFDPTIAQHKNVNVKTDKLSKKIILDSLKSYNLKFINESKNKSTIDRSKNISKEYNKSDFNKIGEILKSNSSNLNSSQKENIPVRFKKDKIKQSSFVNNILGNGRATFNPSSLDFENVYLFKKSQIPLIVTNSGSDTLKFSGFFINTTIGGFSKEISSNLISLAPLEFDTLYINFQPIISGVDTGYIYLNHNGINGKDSLRIEGNGVTPTFEPSTWNMFFRNLTINNSKIDSIKIQNNSSEDTLIITSITSTNSVFQILSDTISMVQEVPTISPNNYLYVLIRFTPTTITTYNEKIIFTHNGATSPDTVYISGGGEIGILSLNANLAQMKKSVVNHPTTENLFTISNNAVSTPLVISSVSSTNSVFSAILENTNISAGGSASLKIRYSPTTGRVDTGKIIISHNGESIRDTVTIIAEAINSEFLSNKSKIDFGDVGNNSTKIDSVQISNTMLSDTLNISDVQIYVDGFTVSPKSGKIAPNNNLKFYITYSPKKSIDSTEVLFFHNGILGVDTVTVVGRKADGNFSASTRTINFGTISLNTQKADSIIITNLNSLAPLEIYSAKTNSINFSISPSSASIPIGGSIKFYLNFAPTTRGDYSKNIVFTHNGKSLSDTINLLGRAPYPIPEFSRRNISFGTIKTGNAITDTFYVFNNSNYEELKITSIEFSNPAFEITPQVATIEKMGRQTFALRFLPTENKSYTSKIIFSHDGEISSDTILVSGFGSKGKFSSSLSTLNFGSVPIKTIKTDTILISNLSTEIPLKIFSVKSSNESFHSELQELEILPLSSSKLPISFSALKSGQSQGNLIFNHDGISSTDTLSLIANVVSPSLTFQSQVGIGIINVNSKITKKINLSNPTIAPITIKSFSVNNSDLKIIDNFPKKINGNDTSSLTFSLKPSFVGDVLISIILNHDGDKKFDTILVTGKSDVPVIALPYQTGFENNNLKEIPEGWMSYDYSNSGQTFLVHNNLFYLPGNDTKFIGINADSLRGQNKKIHTKLISPVFDITNTKNLVLLSFVENFETVDSAISKVSAIIESDTILVGIQNSHTGGWIEKKLNFTDQILGKKSFQLIFEYFNNGKSDLGWGIDNIIVDNNPIDTTKPIVNLISSDNFTMRKTETIRVEAIDNIGVDSVFFIWESKDNLIGNFVKQTPILFTHESNNIWKLDFTIQNDPEVKLVNYYTLVIDKSGNKTKSETVQLFYTKNGQHTPYVENFDGVIPKIYFYNGFEILKTVGENNSKGLALDAFKNKTSAKASTAFINISNEVTKNFYLHFDFESKVYKGLEHRKILGDSIVVKISINQEAPRKIFKIDSSTNLSNYTFTKFIIPLDSFINYSQQLNSIRIFFEAFADTNELSLGKNYLLVIDDIQINHSTDDTAPPFVAGNFNYFATTKTDSVKVEVLVLDNVGVRDVLIHYYTNDTLHSKQMYPSGLNRFVGYINGFPQGTRVHYAVFVTDSTYNTANTPLVIYDVVGHKNPPYNSSLKNLPLYLYSGKTNENGDDENVGFHSKGVVDEFEPNFHIATDHFLPIKSRSIFSFNYLLQAIDSNGILNSYQLQKGDSLIVYLLKNEKEQIILDTISSSNQFLINEYFTKTFDVSSFKNDSLQFHIVAKLGNNENKFTFLFNDLKFENYPDPDKVSPKIKLLDTTISLNVFVGTIRSSYLRFTNLGTGYLNYSVKFENDFSWLFSLPSSDSILTGKIQSLKIIAFAELIEKGVYNTFVTLTSNDASNPSIKIPLLINVLERNSLLVHNNSNGAFALPAVTVDGVIWGSNGHGDLAKAVFVPVGSSEYEISNVKIAFAKWHNYFNYSLEIFSGNLTNGPTQLLYKAVYTLDRIKQQKHFQDSSKQQYFVDSVQFTDHFLSTPIKVTNGCFIVVRFNEISSSPGAMSIVHNDGISDGTRTWDLSYNKQWSIMNSSNSWGKEYLPFMIVTSYPSNLQLSVPEVSNVTIHDSLHLKLISKVTSDKKINDLSLTFEFPDSILNFVRVENKNSLLKDVEIKIEQVYRNRVRINFSSTEGVNLTDGTLLELVFATQNVGEKQLKILNYSVNNYSEYGSTIDGSINVKGLTFDPNDEKLIPKEFALYQNFPNPFNPSTTIKFDLPKQSKVSIIIYDMLGREITKLVDGKLNFGSHKVSWNASKHPSGIYLVLMRTDEFIQTKKIILIK